MPRHTRRKPVQRRSLDTIAVILEGAARVFQREGYSATTNRIAEEAGVGVGSIYEYFPNKDALLVALGRKHLDEVEEALAPHIRAEGALEAPELARGLLSAVLALHRKYPRMHETLRRVAEVEPELRDRATALEHEAVGALAQALGSRLDSSTAELRARVVVSTLGHLTHALIVSESDPELAARLEAEVERMLGLALG